MAKLVIVLSPNARRQRVPVRQLGLPGIDLAISTGIDLIKGLFDKKKIRQAEENQRDVVKEAAYVELAGVQQLAGTGIYSPDAIRQMSEKIVADYYVFVSQFRTKSVRDSANNFRAMKDGFNDRVAWNVQAARDNYRPPSPPVIQPQTNAGNNNTTAGTAGLAETASAITSQLSGYAVPIGLALAIAFLVKK